jgi:hypothetical protein
MAVCSGIVSELANTLCTLYSVVSTGFVNVERIVNYSLVPAVCALPKAEADCLNIFRIFLPMDSF